MTAPRPDSPVRRWLAPGTVAGGVLLLLLVPSWLANHNEQRAVVPAPDGLESPRITRPAAPAAGITLIGYTTDSRQLTLRYTIRVSDCYAGVARPEVAETDDAVTVTLHRLPVRSRSAGECAKLTLTDSVTVHLDEPLGGRLVRDGGRGGAVVPSELPETSR